MSSNISAVSFPVVNPPIPTLYKRGAFDSQSTLCKRGVHCYYLYSNATVAPPANPPGCMIYPFSNTFTACDCE